MDKNKNEELQSRRQFFKSAAKAALPILGAVVLSNIPLAKSVATTTCQDGCWFSCAQGCGGACSRNCQTLCAIQCSQSCTSGCGNSCYNTCSGGCARNAYA